MTIKELKARAALQDQGTAKQNPDITGAFCISSNSATDQPTPTRDQTTGTPETVTRSATGTREQTEGKRATSKSVHTKEKKSVHTTQEISIQETPPEIIQQELQQDQPDNIQQKDIISDNTPHALPPGLYDDITATIDFYCQNNDITDRLKIHPLQWQGICYRVGETIKQRKLLHDHQREKAHGGTVYDGEKIAALLDLYGVICADYKQVAFTFNFARFAGISVDYLHDYMAKGLTSSRVGLREKALDLQKASLVGAVTGGGSATVGNIFLSKALAGLQETVTVQHVSAAAAPVSNALPVFGGDNPALPVSEEP